MTPDAVPLGASAAVLLLALVGPAVFILLVDRRGVRWRLSAWVALTSLVIAAVLELIASISQQGGPIQGLLEIDGLGAAFALFFCAAGGAIILLAIGTEDEPANGAYTLLLLGVSGALVVAHSIHMLPIAVGLSILYTTSAAWLGVRNAWRYLVHHSIGMALFLFGMALLYGAGGSLGIDLLTEGLQQVAAHRGLVTLGTGLVLAGLAFPMALVPFHAWLYPVCEGIRPASGLFATLILPAAAIAALVRLGDIGTQDTSSMLVVLGAVSVCYGYAHALASTDLEALVVGHTVAQAGTMVLALVAVPMTDLATLLFTLGATGVSLTCLRATMVNARPAGTQTPSWGDIAGFGRRHPWLASAATLALLNVSGLFPLMGSIAQFRIYRALAEAEHWGAVALAAVAILMSWLLAGRWISVTWMREPADGAWSLPSPEIATLALLSAAVVLAGGIFADGALNWISRLIGGS